MVRLAADRRVLLGTGLAFLATAALIFGGAVPAVEEACGAPALDVRAYSSAQEVHRFLVDCGAMGRAAYQRLQLLDLAYPALSGAFFTLVLAGLAARVSHPGRDWSRVGVVPLTSMVADYLENASAWVALARYPEAGLLDGALGVFSLVKQLTGWASAVVFVVLIAILALRRIWSGAARG